MTTTRQADPRVQRQRADQILDKMYEMAAAGDVAAASLFLDRVLGPVLGPGRLSEGPPAEQLHAADRPAPSIPKRLLSAAEVAEVAGISLGLVYRLQRTGKLPVCRIGRRVLVRRDDLEILVRAKSAGEE